MATLIDTPNSSTGIPNLPQEFAEKWGDWSVKVAEAIQRQAAAVRVCQKIWEAEFLRNETTVPDDSLDLPKISNIKEKDRRQLVEIKMPFTLTPGEMDNEPTKKIGYFLGQVNARALAQVEDLILFQGTKAQSPLLKIVTLTNEPSAGTGLLGAADPGPEQTSDSDPTRVSVPIDIYFQRKRRPGVKWGENLFAAVNSGVTKLSGKGQSTNYALILPIVAYADAQTPPGDQSLVTTYDRLKDWLKGGIYGTAMLPEDRGLLVAVSNATALYVSVDAQTEYVARDDTGDYRFLVREKFQFIARDPRALVLLRFENTEAPADLSTQSPES
jgi:uncharacterized linocin/CFP29 family protein